MAHALRSPWRDTHAALVARLWRDSGAAQWQLHEAELTAALERSLAHRFPGAWPDDHAVGEYLESLHVTDLALATACALGSDPAWEHFILQYRPVLYRVATALGGERGREIADSLYADLYGLEQREGERRSLFRYYHGRSSLVGWLRAVLAQRVVDRVRSERRLEALPDVDPPAPADRTGRDPHRWRYLCSIRDALRRALDSLEPKDRLRLAMYYARGVKLAAIGRVLGESEATVSRKLDRTRKHVRGAVEATLRDAGFSSDEIALGFEYAAADWPFDLSEVLPLQRPP